MNSTTMSTDKQLQSFFDLCDRVTLMDDPYEHHAYLIAMAGRILAMVAPHERERLCNETIARLNEVLAELERRPIVTDVELDRLRLHPAYREIMVRWDLDNNHNQLRYEVMFLDGEMCYVLREDGASRPDDYFRVMHDLGDGTWTPSYSGDTLEELAKERIVGGSDEDEANEWKRQCRRRLRAIVNETGVSLGGLIPEAPAVDLFG